MFRSSFFVGFRPNFPKLKKISTILLFGSLLISEWSSASISGLKANANTDADADADANADTDTDTGDEAKQLVDKICGVFGRESERAGGMSRAASNMCVCVCVCVECCW